MSPFEEHSYIYGYARTPIGKFGGSLSSLSAPDLAALCIREALSRSGVPPEKITDVILGNVLSAGLGQAPARQASLKSGLPAEVGTDLVNKVCGSGLLSIIWADERIRLGEAGFVVAGGMESMSRSPLIFSRPKENNNFPELADSLDSMILDGLWDSFGDCHMGQIAEALARQENYSREDQDNYARESYLRAREAQDRCFFSEEIVPVPIKGEGWEMMVDKDEEPYAHDLEKISSLPPVFDKDSGTITAGNASAINDGAAVVVMGPKDNSLKPIARVMAHATHSLEPDQFPIAPVEAIKKVVSKWGVGLGEIDLFEINEAFAVTTMAVCDQLGLDKKKVNINGGAVALGHPIGASGARILVTLLHSLRSENLGRGIAAICIGGGEALSLGVEMLEG